MPYLTMAPTTKRGADPFADPDHISDDTDYDEGSTLPVGRDASLTLATDSLIVLGTDIASKGTVEELTVM